MTYGAIVDDRIRHRKRHRYGVVAHGICHQQGMLRQLAASNLGKGNKGQGQGQGATAATYKACSVRYRA